MLLTTPGLQEQGPCLVTSKPACHGVVSHHANDSLHLTWVYRGYQIPAGARPPKSMRHTYLIVQLQAAMKVPGLFVPGDPPLASTAVSCSVPCAPECAHPAWLCPQRVEAAPQPPDDENQQINPKGRPSATHRSIQPSHCSGDRGVTAASLLASGGHARPVGSHCTLHPTSLALRTAKVGLAFTTPSKCNVFHKLIGTLFYLFYYYHYF